MPDQHKRTQTILPPKDGWQPNTVYLVEVAMHESNPIHRALFYSGFLNGKGEDGEWPGGYNNVISPVSPQEPVQISKVRYLKVIEVLADDKDFKLRELTCVGGHLKQQPIGPLPADREAWEEHKCPEFVAMHTPDGTALRYHRETRTYYRAAGNWSCGYRRMGDEFCAVPLDENTKHLDGMILHPCTKEHWKEDNQ
jgi:hypothetical protein